MSNNSLIAVIVIAVIVAVLLCVDTESYGKTAGPISRGVKRRKKPNALASLPPPTQATAPQGHQGNIVYYGPVDANLLQITSTGVSY